MEIACYKKCGTCQKAKKFLMNHGVEYNDREIIENPLTFSELKDAYEKSGLKIKSFLNTSGLVYRELEMKDKVKTMSSDEILHVISQHPMLMKRPILTHGSTVLVGFKEDDWKKALHIK